MPDEGPRRSETDSTAHPDHVSEDATGIGELFRVLAERRRRDVLSHLEDVASIEVYDLAERIAAKENGCTTAKVSPSATKHVAAELHHIHLPKLDDFSAVEYDVRTGTVRPGEHDELVNEYLALADRDKRS